MGGGSGGKRREAHKNAEMRQPSGEKSRLEPGGIVKIIGI
jgi:hypothetical protein